MKTDIKYTLAFFECGNSFIYFSNLAKGKCLVD